MLCGLKGHGSDYAHDRGTPPAMPRNSSLWLSSCLMDYPLDETACTASSASDNYCSSSMGY